MRNEDSLATILLVSRMQTEGTRPLSATEFWKLRRAVPRPGILLGEGETRLTSDHGLSRELSARIVALLDRARVMAFEMERLEHAGIWTVTPFDEHYPKRLLERLDSQAPALIHAAGAFEGLGHRGVGVVGSRDVSAEGAAAAQDVAAKAVELGFALVSGGARGVDKLAMNAAFQAGGKVVGVLADSLVRQLNNPDVRRAVLEEQVVMCTPFSPKAPFKVWNALGRNKLIYALSEFTLAVAAADGRGGTWSGATEALRRGFGRVGVWRGPGEGSGNPSLHERGAQAIRSIDELEVVIGVKEQDGQELSDGHSSPPTQPSLFEKTA